MNICVFNWQDRENPQAGGAELHLHETFGRIAQAGHAVTVISSGWGSGEPARTRLDGMDVVRCGRRLTYPLHVRQTYRELGGASSFDIVVEDLNKVALFTPRWVGVPTVLLVHHLFGETAFSEAPLPIATATWLLERPIGRMYRGVPVIAVSRSTADDLIARGLDGSDIEVVHNGVNLTQYSPGARRADVPTLLFLGRLKRYKRIEVIIDAVAQLRAAGHSLRLVVAGTGDHRPVLEARVRDLGLEGHVEFVGYVSEDQKVDAFRRSWVHVLMSEKEGWGLTNVEAGACGTATVAADAPGLRDSVMDGETGVLVAGDDVNALAEALLPFVTDLSYADAMGRKAEAFARSLTWERTAEGVQTVLERVLAHTTP